MNSTVSIIAHRGASAYAPENTLPAFQLAWQMGADGIEGDFRLTADGQIVCIHDATTERTADINLPVETTEYAQLRTVNVAHAFTPHGSSAHIPLLSEVIDTVPSGKQLFIELKSGSDIVPPLIEQLNQCQLTKDQITLFSFSTEVLQAIQATDPSYRTGLIIDFKIALNGKLTPPLEDSLRSATQLGCKGLHIGANLRLPKDIGVQTHARGLQLHTWTIDTHKLSQFMQTLGVQSITTNKPDGLFSKCS